MIKYKLRVNDSVFVEKGGEIIPKITGIDFNNRGLFVTFVAVIKALRR